jgi:hypothetical protein
VKRTSSEQKSALSGQLFLATGLGKKKSGTAGSCLKQVKIYLPERLLDRLPLATSLKNAFVDDLFYVIEICTFGL